MIARLVKRVDFARFDSWIYPFLWVLVAPNFMGPLYQLDFFYRCASSLEASGTVTIYRCPSFGADIFLTYAPAGVISLAAFGWLASSQRKVQLAAVLAGLLGVAGALAPALVFLPYLNAGPVAFIIRIEDVIGLNFIQLLLSMKKDGNFIYPLPFSCFIWIITLLVAGCFALVRRATPGDQHERGTSGGPAVHGQVSSGLRPWTVWIVVTTLATHAGLLVGYFVIAMFQLLLVVILTPWFHLSGANGILSFTLIVGIVCTSLVGMGYAQQQLLESFLGPRLGHRRGWIPATVLGGMVGFIVAIALGAVGRVMNASLDLLFNVALVALGIGLGQWYVLRHSAWSAGWWVPATVIGLVEPIVWVSAHGRPSDIFLSMVPGVAAGLVMMSGLQGLVLFALRAQANAATRSAASKDAPYATKKGSES